MVEFELLDDITICGAASLSADDNNVLSLLYTPLIKQNGYSLYMVFQSLLERESYKSSTYKYRELLDILGLKKHEFTVSRVKLEAIGLITTYKDNNSYIIMLKAPMTAKQFLSDGMLGMYLYSEVGDHAFKKLQSLFSIPKIEKARYENITASFDDAFQSNPSVVIDDVDYLMDKHVNKGVKAKAYNFDFEEFKNVISSAFLENQKITERFKTFILNLAFAYGYSVSDMKELYTKSLNSSGYFDYKLASKRAREMYDLRYTKCLPNLSESEELVKSEMENMLEKLTAKQVIEKFSKANVATSEEISSVNDLYNEYEGYGKAYIHLAVITSIKKCDGIAPNYKYYVKVINDWISKGLLTVDAVSQSLQEQTEPGKKKTSKNSYNTKDDNPEWLKEYVDTIESRVQKL